MLGDYERDATGGGYRKVWFVGDGPGQPPESMWVRVEAPDARSGTVANDPAYLTWTKYGDHISFGDDWMADRGSVSASPATESETT